MCKIFQYVNRWRVFTAIIIFPMINIGCMYVPESSILSQQNGAVQTVVVKSGTERLKIVDTANQREIEIAWNNHELQRLDAQTQAAEILRLPIQKTNAPTTPSPIAVVVINTQKKAEADRKQSQFQASPALTSAHIRQITLKDANGFFINPGNDGKYHVRAGESVQFDVVLDLPSKQPISVNYAAKNGRIEANALYVAPDTPGEYDLVKVKVFNATTGGLMDMDVIEMKIVDTQ